MRAIAARRDRGGGVKYWLKRILLALAALVIVVPLGLRGAAWLRESASAAEAMPAEGRLVATAMGDVYIEEAGPVGGVPVLLMHGSVGWSGLWRETLEALGGAGYRAIAFDLPPMGFSARDPVGDYGRVRQAQRVLALAEAMGIRPVMAAHSFGAGPGVEAVMRKRGAFRALVVIDGALALGGHEREGRLPWALRPEWLRQVAISATVTNPLAIKPLLALFLHRKDRANDHYAEILLRPGAVAGTTAELARWLPALLVPPRDAQSTRAEAFRALDMPTAIIWGREDTTTPLAQGVELQALIPGADLIVLDDVGHIPQIEDPALFNAALIAALEKLVDPGR